MLTFIQTPLPHTHLTADPLNSARRTLLWLMRLIRSRGKEMLLLQHYYFFFSDASVVGAAHVACKAVTSKGWRCLLPWLSQLLAPFCFQLLLELLGWQIPWISFETCSASLGNAWRGLFLSWSCLSPGGAVSELMAAGRFSLRLAVEHKFPDPEAGGG